MGDYIGNRCLDIMSLFLHFKVKITVFTYTVVHPCTPLQKRGLLFLTKRLPRKRNQNWRTFDNSQKVIVCESQ